ncbi:sporulation membrane protein YtrI [Virgibacillus siamensis]|uniref:sporulation membrane protein YtrI n=1 Tax=Virgibacillus siamensis TaxID=480071 RepID=UPI000986757F|nr:sporulation membrane protein YtrI [Virgibacillus siamensis]
MHIPPYYKKPSWQRFFAGAFFGACIAYFIFVYMHGFMYEQLLGENKDLQSQVAELKKQNEALLQDNQDLNEKTEEPLTVNSIEITITNQDELRLDKLIIHDLEELMKEEIDHIIGKDVSIIDESAQLLISSLENKEYTVDDFNYGFTIKKLTISKTLKITAEAELAD